MIDPEAPTEGPRGSFLANVNVVLVTYAVDGAIAFVSGAIVARALGPGGAGAFGLFVIATAFGQMVLGLGFGNAVVYYINRRELTVRDVVSAAYVVTAGAATVTAIAVVAIVPWAGDEVLGAGVSAWLLVAAVPALVYSAAMRIVLQAQSRFIEMGAATLSQPLLMLAAVVALYALGDVTPPRVAAIWIVSNVASGVLAFTRIGVSNVDLAAILRPRWRTIERLARFGVQGESGNILQLMNYRLDQYIVRGFVGLAGVGIYAVGVSMTEAVWMIANAVAIVLVPRLTADEAEARWMAPVATRNTLVVAAGGAIALAVIAPFVLPAVFGHAFDGSVHALWLLLPGTVALTGSKVLTSYIFSRGRPLVNTGITIVSLVVTTIALFALVPRYGINGAAAASSLAYGAHFVAALFAYRRISGQPIMEALLPARDDLRLYTDALRSIRTRLRRRPPIDADHPQGAAP